MTIATTNRIMNGVKRCATAAAVLAIRQVLVAAASCVLVCLALKPFIAGADEPQLPVIPSSKERGKPRR